MQSRRSFASFQDIHRELLRSRPQKKLKQKGNLIELFAAREKMLLSKVFSATIHRNLKFSIMWGVWSFGAF